MRRALLGLMILLLGSAVAAAQFRLHEGGAQSAAKVEKPKPKPKPAPKKPPPPKLPPAQDLFGSVQVPAPLAARAIGSYSKGCLAGGVALPINGPDWQVMRVSRNRNWGSPQLIDLLERLASDARALDGWPGLLVGDLSQPRGGPMLTGHTSHQVGLDADIWLTPMPADRWLTLPEREEMEAVSMLKDPFSVDINRFTDLHVKLIRRAATYPQVARIFVHPAIKKSLCKRADVAGKDQRWLSKVRPWWNHHYHFHIRMKCPQGMEGCVNQNPVAGDTGCDGKEFAYWDKTLRKSAIWQAEQKLKSNGPPAPGKRKQTPLRELPKECATVLEAGGLTPLGIDDELPAFAQKAVASKDAGPTVPILTAAQLQIVRNGGQLNMPLPVRNPDR